MCFLCDQANQPVPAAATGVDKVSLSLKDGAQKLLQANASWTYNNNLTTIVTYGFRNSPPDYNVSQSDLPNTFERVSVSEMAMIREAIRVWSNIADIRFVEVNPGGYSDNAAILFGNYSSKTDGSNGFAYYPRSKNTAGSSSEGDVWLNNFDGGFFDVKLGNYDFLTILHEIGHALGLSHPGNYNAGRGVTNTYAANAEFKEDTLQYSVMSYFQASELGAQHGSQYATTPLLLDMIAIQQLYGQNKTGTSGDDVYGFNSTQGPAYSLKNASDVAVFSIWDSGGIDTLDVSQYVVNQSISLVEASFSDIGGLTRNISVAAGAVIENARGGSGHDIITGNFAKNFLWGGAGDDQISGGGGNDALYGEAGDDRLSGGFGDDLLDGGAGHDVAVYFSRRADYAASKLSDRIIVTDRIANRDGVDTLVFIERIKFTDGDLVFDVVGARAPAAYRLYGGAFDRTPDEGGFRYWAAVLEANAPLRDVAASFIVSAEFVTLYGTGLSNASFVNALYRNVLDRPGDEGGVLFWNRALDQKSAERADVLVEFTQLPEYVGISMADVSNGYWLA